MKMTATKVKFDENTHEYEYPRQTLYELNVAIMNGNDTGKHLLVSQSHPRIRQQETAVFLADEVGNVISYAELDMVNSHVDHDEMIKRSPYKLMS